MLAGAGAGANSKNPLRGAVEIIPVRAVLPGTGGRRRQCVTGCLSVDPLTHSFVHPLALIHTMDRTDCTIVP